MAEGKAKVVLIGANILLDSVPKGGAGAVKIHLPDNMDKDRQAELKDKVVRVVGPDVKHVKVGDVVLCQVGPHQLFVCDIGLGDDGYAIVNENQVLGVQKR